MSPSVRIVVHIVHTLWPVLPLSLSRDPSSKHSRQNGLCMRIIELTTNCREDEAEREGFCFSLKVKRLGYSYPTDSPQFEGDADSMHDRRRARLRVHLTYHNRRDPHTLD
jgi:hypothetical protein